MNNNTNLFNTSLCSGIKSMNRDDKTNKPFAHYGSFLINTLYLDV